MKFGLFGGARARGGPAGDSHAYHDFVNYVTEAEKLGFSSVFLVEHHFTGFGQISASMSLLAYLAARTERIRLGTAVVVLPWHNPILVAEQAATLDLLSNGRLDFGVGKGYRAYEFSGFCIPPEEATERFDEAMTVIRKAWTSPGRFSYRGKWWHYENVVVEHERIFVFFDVRIALGARTAGEVADVLQHLPACDDRPFALLLVVHNLQAAGDANHHRVVSAPDPLAFVTEGGNALDDEIGRRDLVEQQIVAFACGAADRFGTASAEPEGRMGLLDRARLDDNIVIMPPLAAI